MPKNLKYNADMQVPYDTSATPMVYPGGWDFDRWADNVPFFATLKLTGGLSTGRSAKRFDWVDGGTGKIYEMFASTLANTVVAFGIPAGGVVGGYWAFCKRGQNYGLMFVGTEDPNV